MKHMARAGVLVAYLLIGSVSTVAWVMPSAVMAQEDDSSGYDDSSSDDSSGDDSGGSDEGSSDDGSSDEGGYDEGGGSED